MAYSVMFLGSMDCEMDGTHKPLFFTAHIFPKEL